MPENNLFPPEGLRPSSTFSLSDLREAMENRSILEAPVQRCDTNHTLHIRLGSVQGQMPRREGIAPWISGSSRASAA